MHPSPAPAASAPRHHRHHPPAPPRRRPRPRPRLREQQAAPTGSRPSWPANAFSTAATVTLTTTTLRKKTQGFAAGSYIAQLESTGHDRRADRAVRGPVMLHFGPLAPGLVPAYSPDGITWTPLARTNEHRPSDRERQPLQPSQRTGRSPSPPSFPARSVYSSTRPAPRDRLSPPGSAAEACSCAGSPQPTTATPSPATSITFGGKPILTLAGTATHATITNFHTNGISVFRVVAADSAANQSDRLQGNRHHTQDPDPRSPSSPSRNGPGSSPRGNPRANTAHDPAHRHPSQPGTGHGPAGEQQPYKLRS